MRTPFCILVGLVLLAPPVFGQITFPDAPLLIGAKRNDQPTEFIVQQISKTGELGEILFRTNNVITSGRLDRTRQRLAVSIRVGDQPQIFIIDAHGDKKFVADAGPYISAWSHDGKTLTFTRELESYQLSIADSQVVGVKLPQHYIIDDWHPKKQLQTALFLNPRNAIHRKFRGDQYPVRQIDLILPDGTTKPLTTDPSTDNNWSRFSPDGSMVAHYQRVIHDEVPHEKIVICNSDGSNPTTLIDMRKLSFVLRLPWYRPKGHPVWSPDGQSIAWLVNTNKVWSGSGEELELLLIEVKSKAYTRHQLTDKGLDWVSQIDW